MLARRSICGYGLKAHSWKCLARRCRAASVDLDYNEAMLVLTCSDSDMVQQRYIWLVCLNNTTRSKTREKKDSNKEAMRRSTMETCMHIVSTMVTGYDDACPLPVWSSNITALFTVLVPNDKSLPGACRRQ